MSARPAHAPAHIQIESGYDDLCMAAAIKVLTAASDAIRVRGRFTVALSGGTTPHGLYEALAASTLEPRADWSRWHFFWGDERWVPRHHPLSNFLMARKAMLDLVPAVPAQVHPMVPAKWDAHVPPTTEEAVLADASRAARDYEATLTREVDVLESSDVIPPDARKQPPRFDLILLGLGDDGHTASLFPGSAAVEEARAWVVATPAPGGARERALPRLTLTLPVLNAARDALFLVSGRSKSTILATVLGDIEPPERVPSPRRLPAARVAPTDGGLTWLVDADAASDLSPRA
jgi:6-phosphogluconolactonase